VTEEEFRTKFSELLKEAIMVFDICTIEDMIDDVVEYGAWKDNQ
jgi:hypothetical protein